ncbi:hypothetical protein [Deinococcus budaensis]|uniref:Uncharacterized protein n=1 Tax=Deinococcus budaensis TaxID=1665626 RepID=A0A7W8LQD6_9DEIO|nr:hypothetical protein [Deinococcus budaensis]MBB5234619.1 hypothetical protein [Deinococcus budaensis]
MKEDASQVDFIELIFPLADDFGVNEQNEIEDALKLTLERLAIGYVSGPQVGMGVVELSIEIDEQVRQEPQRVIAQVLTIVRALNFPTGSYLLAYPTSFQHVDL